MVVNSAKRKMFAKLAQEGEQALPLLKNIKTIPATFIPEEDKLLIQSKSKPVKTDEDALLEVVKASIQPQNDVDIVSISLLNEVSKLKPGMVVEDPIPIVVTGKRLNKKISEEYQVPMYVKIVRSAASERRDGRYYEGVLQVRNLTDSQLDYVFEAMKKEDKTFVARTLFIQGNDIDLFLTNKRQLKKIALLLQDKFGGEVKLTTTIHTRDKFTQKDVHRQTVYFRRYNVQVGDIAFWNDSVVQVLKAKKNILIKDISTQFNHTLPSDEGLKLVQWEPGVIISHDPMQVVNLTTHETLNVTAVIDTISDKKKDVLIAKSKNKVIVKATPEKKKNQKKR